MAECEITLMDEDQCAHCKPPRHPYEGIGLDYTFTAKFDGVLGCGHHVEEGDKCGRMANADTVCWKCATGR
jgi:hypothetical protein